ncbi:NAD(P)/FAD-dependent oxidoreductase [Erysipelothrix urinaevulpis]|uniref:NAD(P)/FAD-dependent oxidoreductase n=1 Tax=Erysipelothrix urinaevulpis TaxID=2683717 RepID=UPI00135A468B|nr:NAD(P)/FAD-dependent oxidoreductase [Erysipelothrix urinaevulpis]
MRKVEALIIGKGPAGVQAAIYLKRGGVDPIVIGKDIGASEMAHKIDNFYGFPGVSGINLIQQGIEHALALDIEVLEDEVTSISYEDGFIVESTSGTFHAQTVLMATGAHRNIPRIRRIRNYEGKGISYCAVCDAFFFKGKHLAVLGAGKYAESEIKVLEAISDHVMLLTDGQELEGEFPSGIKIITDRLKAVYGDEHLEGIEFRDGSKLELDGLFVAVGTASSSDLAQKLGVQVEGNKVVVDQKMMSNIPGLFAAGDCVPGVQQIAKAVGDGCVAGMSMVDYLRDKKRGK